MNGLWKLEVSGWNHKDSRRKKTSHKNHLKDKRRAITKAIHNGNNGNDKIYREENAQTLTYTGSRWGLDAPLTKYADICKIGFRIPKKGNEYNDAMASYVTIKAYFKGNEYSSSNAWYEVETDKSIRDYFDLSIHQKILIQNRDIEIISKHGKKLLDWSAELQARKKVKVTDFTHYNSNEFIYTKSFNHKFKWKFFYQESTRRKFAHKYVMGQTRASVRNWIQRGDWDAPRKVPYGEISYGWIVD